jgi:hypothetical protein
MHRNRTWQIDPEELRTQRNRILPIEGGDGSTLSLDFTGGVLDPRLTFTRTTNATFINSQGYVEWAAANALSNSVFTGASGATQPTGWLVSFVGGTGSFTLNGTELTISNNGSATRSRIYQTGPTGNGLPVTVQLKVVANNTSGMALVELLSFSINGQGSVVYKVNGTTQLSSFTGWVAGDTITLTCIPTAGSAATCLFGLGASAPVSTSASVTIKDVQIEPGSVARSYIPTTTSGAYQAPRFDYDPTTLAPRGLLFEGDATNLVTQSNGATSVWTIGGNRTPTNNTTDLLSPDGTNNATKLLCGTTGNYAAHATAITGLTGGATYTVSYWMRGPSGHTPRLYAVNGTIGDVTATSTTGTYNNTGWTRLTQTYTLPATTTQVYVYFASIGIVNTGDTFYVWGFQLETGSGASSHIPTGASTGNRTADSCVMNDIAPLQYSTTNGSIYWSGIFNKQPLSYVTLIGFMTAVDQPTYETFGNASNYFTAARGASLSTGGQNEVSRPYTIGSLTRYASAVDTITDPIVRANLNGSASSTTKSGSGNLYAATRFVIGRNPSTTYGISYPSVTIAQIKYWPVTKTAAELNSLTTT